LDKLSSVSDVIPPVAAAGQPRRRRVVGRWTRRLLALGVAVFAALFVAFFSVDLGPLARERAEREGSNYLERPMHIGKLKALVWPGTFELDDVVIEGPLKNDTPFLTAKRIVLSAPWWTLIHKAIFVEVRMTDWTMTIETGPGRPPSLPKLVPRTKSTGPKRFTTTTTVFANRGQFTYVDHGTPWSVVARNLNFDLVRSESLASYVGTAHFDHGTVRIQNFSPMRADLTTRFTLDGSRVHLHHIDLITDGARSSVIGEVDFSRWPEQTYNVDSIVNFARMREIFFANESWRVDGDGRFKGIFHLPQKGGRDLKGQFSSNLATLKTSARTLVFPNLRGSLVWLPDRFAVTDAGADFYGGRSTFAYSLAPLGSARPIRVDFGFDYEDVDLQAFGRALEWTEMDLRGRARGHNEMTWVNGQFGQTMNGAGTAGVAPPDGVRLATAALPALPQVAPSGPAPFDRDRPLGPLPVGGEIKYRLDPDGIDLDPSWVASPSTYVAFHGRADYGPRSNVPFHVTSTDWQESDRVLAAILTAVSAPTRPIEVGGFGQFDGMMTGSFSQARIEGKFMGDAVRSWGVTWGRAAGDLVIQNNEVTIKDGVIGDTAQSTIHADGVFHLGFRQDGGEELRSHVRIENWPLGDFKRAFQLEDWPVEGVVGSADVRLTGAYTGPFGSGTLRIDRGVAWGETFDAVNGDLTFNGVGLQITRIAMTKGPGRVNGSAVIKWDGTYAFDAQGEKIPVETLTSFTVPQAPLSGVLQFTASGAGEFAHPIYEFRAHVADLFAGDQGIGDVSGVLQVRNNTLIIPQLEAASSRLQASGSGNIALNDTYDANLTLRFTDTSIDPYLPFLAPKLAPQISPYTRAKVSGSLQVRGPLKVASSLTVDATINDARLTLFNYDLQNSGEVLLKFEDNVAKINRLQLTGEGTSLRLEGDIPFSSAPMRITATGDANLAILQAFFSSNLISSGAARIDATIGGDSAEPTFAGQATISDGRLRYRSFPHGLEQINGPIRFGADGIHLDGLHGRMGEGDVTFGGRIAFKGFVPDQFDLQADGSNMRLRIPTGFASVVEANLTLRGPVGAPTLGGTVTVLRSAYQQEIDSEQALLALALGTSTTQEFSASSESTLPIRLDVSVNAPGTLAIDTREAQIVGSANLTFGGTVDNPSIIGRVTLDRGNIFFNGNRYTVGPSSIDFSNPSRIVPFFDIDFETKPHVAGQTYDVTIRITGTTAAPNGLNLTLTSDPFLPDSDLVLLLLGQRPDVGTSELRAAQAPQLGLLGQQQLMRTAAAQFLTMPISSRVGSVVQRTTPCDTFSLVPLIGAEQSIQNLTATARLTCGKRISDRVFLTYTRELNATPQQYELILLEYEQSDRVSWILSRNENRTFALDFRIRHIF
jgi:translocation and assembly module TamB